MRGHAFSERVSHKKQAFVGGFMQAGERFLPRQVIFWGVQALKPYFGAPYRFEQGLFKCSPYGHNFARGLHVGA